MTVFDENNHVQIDSYETMCAVAKEIYEGNLTKWRGCVHLVETSSGPGYALEMNRIGTPTGAPSGFTALFTEHIIKLGFGVIIKMTDAEYDEYMSE